jgi:hypothetical protein
MIAKSNNRTLLLLILVLLVTNGIMLYLLTRDEPAHKEEPQLSRTERQIKMIQEELSLDSAQVKQYLGLRDYRDSLLRPIQTDMRKAKMDMTSLRSKDSVSADSIKIMAARVGDGQAKMEIEYFNHFKRMEKMLDEGQRSRFDSLLIRMIYRSTGAGDSLPKVNNVPTN